MVHALIRFWANTYWQYQEPLTGGIRFQLPGFADPLMSPVFVTEELDQFLKNNNQQLAYFNLLGDAHASQAIASQAGFALEQRLSLGVRQLRSLPRSDKLDFEVQPLNQAVHGTELWAILQEGFPKDILFLKKLMPFLATTEARFTTIFLKENQEKVALINLGVSGETCLLITAAVKPQFRGRGHTKRLVDLATDIALAQGATEAFFWTEHEFLLKRADETLDYLVFTRKEEP